MNRTKAIIQSTVASVLLLSFGAAAQTNLNFNNVSVTGEGAIILAGVNLFL